MSLFHNTDPVSDLSSWQCVLVHSGKSTVKITHTHIHPHTPWHVRHGRLILESTASNSSRGQEAHTVLLGVSSWPSRHTHVVRGHTLTRMLVPLCHIPAAVTCGASSELVLLPPQCTVSGYSWRERKKEREKVWARWRVEWVSESLFYPLTRSRCCAKCTLTACQHSN